MHGRCLSTNLICECPNSDTHTRFSSFFFILPSPTLNLHFSFHPSTISHHNPPPPTNTLAAVNPPPQSPLLPSFLPILTPPQTRTTPCPRAQHPPPLTTAATPSTSRPVSFFLFPIWCHFPFHLSLSLSTAEHQNRAAPLFFSFRHVNCCRHHSQWPTTTAAAQSSNPVPPTLSLFALLPG